MCKTFKVLPDSDAISNIDPIQYNWMFQNWLADQKDDMELAKNHAYLLGSFWNPEAVKDLLGNNKHISSSEEFDETLDMVRNANLKALNNKEISNNSTRKRRNRKING